MRTRLAILALALVGGVMAPAATPIRGAELPAASCGSATSLQAPLRTNSWSPLQPFANYNASFGGYHSGEDWVLPGGSAGGKPVYAIGAGSVWKVVPALGDGSIGGMVIVQHTGRFSIPALVPFNSHGSTVQYPASTETTLYSVYIHVTPSVAVGQCVTGSSTIGTIATNNVEGQHLHFEIRPAAQQASHDGSLVGNPSNWVPQSGGGYNGYYIDPQAMINAGVRSPTAVVLANAKAGCGSPSADQVALYEDAAYGGACSILDVGKYANAAAFKLRDNNVSAIKVGSDVAAKLYLGPNFGGNSAAFVSSDADFSNNCCSLNNNTSSVKVSWRNGCGLDDYYTTRSGTREGGLIASGRPVAFCMNLKAGDWYTARANDVYTFDWGCTSTCSNQTNPALTVYRPSGSVVAKNDDFGGSSYYHPLAFVSFVAPASGPYLFAVNLASGAAGSFWMRIDSARAAAPGDVNFDCVVNKADDDLETANYSQFPNASVLDADLNGYVDGNDITLAFEGWADGTHC